MIFPGRTMLSNLKIFSIFAFLFFLSLSFSACNSRTGSQRTGSQAPGVDGDFVQGNKPRTFYKTISATSGTAVVIDKPGDNGQKFQISLGNVISQGEIPAKDLQISPDGSVLIVKDDSGLYEISQIKVSEVAAGTPLPTATVESYCTGLSPTNYRFFKILYGASGYQFQAIGSSTDLIGGAGEITKSETTTLMSFIKANFGTLQIDKTQPLATDNLFYKASFSGTSDPWTSIGGMYCHLNSVTFTYHTAFVSSMATDGCFGMGCNGKGMENADTLCKNLAESGSITANRPGKWRAILSSSTENAVDRIKFLPSSFIKGTAGQIVATASPRLWQGGLDAPLNTDENGNPVGGAAWTGSDGGGRYSGKACSDWNFNQSLVEGHYGDVGETNDTWVNMGDLFTCNSQGRVYCINSAE